jgi:hypothetical protein
LWNPALQSYDWAVHDDGTHATTNWTNLYPDALEQMWAVGFGLATGTRATQLVSTFAATHPNWDKPASTDISNGTAGPVEYWPVAGWAMDAAGLTEQAATGAANIRSAELSVARAWPYTPASAGQLTVLLSGGPALA